MFDRREATTVGNGQEIKFCAIDKLYGLHHSPLLDQLIERLARQESYCSAQITVSDTEQLGHIDSEMYRFLTKDLDDRIKDRVSNQCVFWQSIELKDRDFRFNH